jgi:hypothetical protein
MYSGITQAGLIEIITELKGVLLEKNRIIDELRFIISQKDSLLSSGSAMKNQQIFASQMQPNQANSGEEKQEAATVSEKVNQISASNTQSGGFVAQGKVATDQKDGLIKELIQIITTQLDWRKVESANSMIKKYVTPIIGKYRFDDGTYEGEIVAGQPNGKGRTVLDNGDAYEGEYLHGMKNGKGVYHWKNGDCYEGDHEAGFENGIGKYTYADGDIYEGEYLEGKRHGLGVLKLRSGTVEFGYFKKGQYNGKCIMISPDEKMVSCGELIENKQHGNWNFYSLTESHGFTKGEKNS